MDNSKKIEVFHTGFLEIPKPDIHFGRKNADFGQGFYVTSDQEFASRWAKMKKDQTPVMNSYELNMEGLKVYQFTRSDDWFKYIFKNRRGYEDTLEADLVIGPIANDTIYDTLGIFTSGYLTDETALELLMVGPEYIQIALKSENAANHLTWTGAQKIREEEVIRNREIVKAEQDKYLTLISRKLEEI